MRTCLALPALLVAGACSSPVNYSQPVGIELKTKSSDVANNAIADEKEITTESGNPYGGFVNAAKSALGNKDPTRIEVDSATLELGAGSTGVTALGGVFDGTVEVMFQIDTTNDTFPVGTANVDPSTGSGPIDLAISFDGSTVGAADFQQMLNGSFKVSVRGPAASGFASAGASASVQTTFTFAAFE